MLTPALLMASTPGAVCLHGAARVRGVARGPGHWLGAALEDKVLVVKEAVAEGRVPAAAVQALHVTREHNGLAEEPHDSGHGARDGQGEAVGPPLAHAAALGPPGAHLVPL